MKEKKKILNIKYKNSLEKNCNIVARRNNWRPSARDSSSLNQPSSSLPPSPICFNHSSTPPASPTPKIGQTFHFVSSLGPSQLIYSSLPLDPLPLSQKQPRLVKWRPIIISPAVSTSSPRSPGYSSNF